MRASSNVAPMQAQVQTISRGAAATVYRIAKERFGSNHALKRTIATLVAFYRAPQSRSPQGFPLRARGFRGPPIWLLALARTQRAFSSPGGIAEWEVDFEKIVTVEGLGGYLACPEPHKKAKSMCHSRHRPAYGNAELRAGMATGFCESTEPIPRLIACTRSTTTVLWPHLHRQRLCVGHGGHGTAKAPFHNRHRLARRSAAFGICPWT